MAQFGPGDPCVRKAHLSRIVLEPAPETGAVVVLAFPALARVQSPRSHWWRNLNLIRSGQLGVREHRKRIYPARIVLQPAPETRTAVVDPPQAGHQAVFLFDSAISHTAFAPDALR